MYSRFLLIGLEIRGAVGSSDPHVRASTYIKQVTSHVLRPGCAVVPDDQRCNGVQDGVVILEWDSGGSGYPVETWP